MKAFGARWKWVVNATPWPFYPLERNAAASRHTDNRENTQNKNVLFMQNDVLLALYQLLNTVNHTLKEVPTEQNLKFGSRGFQTLIGTAGDRLEFCFSLSAEEVQFNFSSRLGPDLPHM
jgi:hypothetical protein